MSGDLAPWEIFCRGIFGHRRWLFEAAPVCRWLLQLTSFSFVVECVIPSPGHEMPSIQRSSLLPPASTRASVPSTPRNDEGRGKSANMPLRQPFTNST